MRIFVVAILACWNTVGARDTEELYTDPAWQPWLQASLKTSCTSDPALVNSDLGNQCLDLDDAFQQIYQGNFPTDTSCSRSCALELNKVSHNSYNVLLMTTIDMNSRPLLKQFSTQCQDDIRQELAEAGGVISQFAIPYLKSCTAIVDGTIEGTYSSDFRKVHYYSILSSLTLIAFFI